jgi:hypothetical protein
MPDDRRREPRKPSELLVLLWGIDAEGLPFAQSAIARNISRQGALLSGVKQPLRCEDPIMIQVGTKRARFRVIWTRDSKNGEKILAAVQKLETQECPWEDQLEVSLRATAQRLEAQSTELAR